MADKIAPAKPPTPRKPPPIIWSGRCIEIGEAAASFCLFLRAGDEIGGEWKITFG